MPSRPLPHLQGLLAELNHLREDVWLPAGCDVCLSISAVLLFTQDVRELFFFLGEISHRKKRCSLNLGFPPQNTRKKEEDGYILFCAEWGFLEADAKTQAAGLLTQDSPFQENDIHCSENRRGPQAARRMCCVTLV